MIQCVGSRNQDNPYCSRVCCSQAVANALRLKESNPNMEVIVLYRDIRTFGLKEQYYKKARQKGILFIRYDLDQSPEVFEKDNTAFHTLFRADPQAGDRFIAGPYCLERGHETPSPGHPELPMSTSFPGMTGGTFSRPTSSSGPWISPRTACSSAGTGMDRNSRKR